jgi:hypothetical protein
MNAATFGITNAFASAPTRPTHRNCVGVSQYGCVADISALPSMPGTITIFRDVERSASLVKIGVATAIDITHAAKYPATLRFRIVSDL